jgi:putative PIG3 family NAD(P)H quinone oxidoreductase
MKAIQIEQPGEDYRLTVADRPQPRPLAGQMLIKVAAAGLNNADILQARGKYPPPPGAPETLGMEVSGIVAELGDGVEGIHPGDPVCALMAGGGYADYALADQACVLPVPKQVDLVQAGGLPEACFTAWANIAVAGRLAEGEKLLVHGGTSGIGVMAVQIFASLGHTVFATAGSPEKCAAAQRLGAARAINYRTEDFVEVVKEATGGKGVDVILDLVGGDYVDRNMHAAARGGRIVNIAYQKGMTAQVNFAPMLMKHLTLTATTLRGRSAGQKGELRDALAAKVWPLLAAGRIKPVTERIFPLDQADAAHRAFRDGGHIGKILLVP